MYDIQQCYLFWWAGGGCKIWSFGLMEEHALRAFKKRQLRRIAFWDLRLVTWNYRSVEISNNFYVSRNRPNIRAFK
jgi:hypothetical protein